MSDGIDVNVIARFANEGIPVAVMARGFNIASELIRDAIKCSIENGIVTEMPREDWPPTARRADHLPSQLAKEQDDHLLTGCMRAFNITKLQAAFMLVLIKRDEADKDTLHNVIEAQRMTRRNQPADLESVDPKMVDVVVCNLRKRLRPYWPPGHETIKTLWGHGYFVEKTDRNLALDKIRAVVQTVPHEDAST